MPFQGIEFNPGMRKMVVNVKHYFDSIRNNYSMLEMPSTQLAASALDISESAVKVIMAAFNKNGEDGLYFSNIQKRGRPSYTLESGIEPVIRQFIREANKEGAQVNIEIIRNFIAMFPAQLCGEHCRDGGLNSEKASVQHNLKKVTE